jgi:hypothetical protein
MPFLFAVVVFSIPAFLPGIVKSVTLRAYHRVPHNYLNLVYEIQPAIRTKSLVNYETSGKCKFKTIAGVEPLPKILPKWMIVLLPSAI